MEFFHGYITMIFIDNFFLFLYPSINTNRKICLIYTGGIAMEK